MQQHATLTLEMVLLVLQTHQQTCTLRAPIPPETLVIGRSIQVPCQAEFRVTGGRVTSGLVRDLVHGQKMLEGQAAFEALAHMVLAWVIEPQQGSQCEHTVASRAQEGAGVAYDRWSRRAPPRLARVLKKRDVDAFSHHTRQLLLLIDGVRGIADFCRILQREPGQLFPLLDALEDAGWIV